MEYTKPPLTFEEQADLIISRGLKADRDRLIDRLKNVNYYRLSAYLYPFRLTDSDRFQEKTTLDLIWKYYTFDRQLRLIVMDEQDVKMPKNAEIISVQNKSEHI